MDIDHEWEILPDDGYLDFNEVSENHQIQFLGKRNNRVVDDYFTTEAAPWNHHHVPIIQLLEPRIVVNNKATDGDDDETVSHNVFFSKKNKIGHQFVEMKMDRCCSPKYVSRGLLVTPTPTPPPPPSSIIDEGDEVTSPRMMIMKNNDEEEEESSGDGELNIWKWGMNGVGAIFSFGVAAATICVFFFGTAHHRNTIQHHKIRFQIYTDDKRLTQVVQNANKLNEAISAIRGVPLRRAHITYGGYYDPFDL